MCCISGSSVCCNTYGGGFSAAVSVYLNVMIEIAEYFLSAEEDNQ